MSSSAPSARRASTSSSAKRARLVEVAGDRCEDGRAAQRARARLERAVDRPAPVRARCGPRVRCPRANQNRQSAAASRSSVSSSFVVGRPGECGAKVVVLDREPLQDPRWLSAPGFRTRRARRGRGSSAHGRRRASVSRPCSARRASANSRIVASIAKRGAPSSAVRLRSRLLSQSEVTSSSARAGVATTLSIASSDAPPTKTARREKRCLLLLVEHARSSSRSSRRACAGARAGRGRRR